MSVSRCQVQTTKCNNIKFSKSGNDSSQIQKLLRFFFHLLSFFFLPLWPNPLKVKMILKCSPASQWDLTSAARGRDGRDVTEVGGLERRARAHPLVRVVGEQRGQELVAARAEVVLEDGAGGGGGLPLGEHRLVVWQRGDARPRGLGRGAQDSEYPRI